MNALNTKLAFSALAIAMLTTPALAARSHGRVDQRPIQNAQQQIGTYPNGAPKTGTADSVESGAEFNLLKNNATD